MKPFNLQAALDGAPVVTRDGRRVKIAGYNPDAAFKDALLGWLNKEAMWWNKEGKYDCENGEDWDLFMAPTERKEWIVRVNDALVSGPFKSLEHAQNMKDGLNGATIHEITIHS